MVETFLFELGCEELPSAAVRSLSEQLGKLLQKALTELNLSFGEIQTFATPRRLAVKVDDLSLQQPTQHLLKKGPALAQAYDKSGQPTQALQGFARACQVDITDLNTIATDKGQWLAYQETRPGQQTCELLPGIMQEVLNKLAIAKPMTWGEGQYRFARPVHWLVMMLGADLIAAEFYGLSTQAHTFGHRFHAPDAIKLEHARDYEPKLHAAYVLANFDTRKQTIKTQIETLACQHQALAVIPDELLEEVSAICEWPEALIGEFESRFLDIPAEVLMTSMQTHQKCFALQDESAKLQPFFVAVSNIKVSSLAIKQGNEKVMHARLNDAAFFYEQDKKQPLSALIPATQKVIFQEKLGTLADKSHRISHLMLHLAAELKLEHDVVERAALLSKCDLLTGMVGEFPNLEGLMGRYYALHDNEVPEVAQALYEQYLPRFAGDKLAQSALGIALSLSDRIDTLVGIFAIGQKPNGMKDPFKLRRHALAVVRMLIELPGLDLRRLLHTALGQFEHIKLKISSSQLLNDLHEFIFERLQSWLTAQDISTDKIQAVRVVQDNDLHDVYQRVQVLDAYTKNAQFIDFMQACKRVNNLLANVDKLEDRPIDTTLLSAPAEQALLHAITQSREALTHQTAHKDYRAMFDTLLTLSSPIEVFFNEVRIQVTDAALKAQRLSLLKQVQGLIHSIAKLSLLQE